jgi:hypothetical protein
VPEVGFICPGGDASADDLADWGTELRRQLYAGGHPCGAEVTISTPCDRYACSEVLRSDGPLVFFFGHGDDQSLLGSAHEAVIDGESLPHGVGKTLVSVACEAGLGVGPAAIQAGVRSHLGWNVLLLWLASDSRTYGEAIVGSLAHFGAGASVSEVADELQRSLSTIGEGYRQKMAADRNARLAYYAAFAAAGQVVIHGDRHTRPLATGLASVARLAVWQGQRMWSSINARLTGGKHG